MDSEYGRIYAELYRRHWWWRSRESFVLSWIRRHLGKRGGAVLDVGCGDGLFLPRLQEFGRPQGLEVDCELISAETRRNWEIYEGPLDTAFQPGKEFDLIVALDVIEHIEHDVAAVCRMRDLLTPEGLLVLTVPALPRLWTRHDDVNHHFRRYSKRSLRQVANAAGLETLQLRYFFLWPVAGKVALKILERLGMARGAHPKLPPRPINRFLTALCALEHAVAAKLPFPLGTSLLLVASGASGSQAPARSAGS